MVEELREYTEITEKLHENYQEPNSTKSKEMKNNTKSAFKKAQLTVNSSMTTHQNEAKQQLTLQDLLNKLVDSLYRIEMKLDNFFNQEQASSEERVAKIEGNADDQICPDTQKKVSNLSDTQQEHCRRIKFEAIFVENKERQYNNKDQNSPHHPQDTKIQVQSKITELLKLASPLCNTDNKLNNEDIVESFCLEERQKLGHDLKTKVGHNSGGHIQQGAAAPRSVKINTEFGHAVQYFLMQGNHRLKQRSNYTEIDFPEHLRPIYIF